MFKRFDIRQNITPEIITPTQVASVATIVFLLHPFNKNNVTIVEIIDTIIDKIIGEYPLYIKGIIKNIIE